MLGHKGVYWRLLVWGRKGGTLQDPRLDFEVDEDLRVWAESDVWGIEFTMLGRGLMEVCNMYRTLVHITYLSYIYKPCINCMQYVSFLSTEGRGRIMIDKLDGKHMFLFLAYG